MINQKRKTAKSNELLLGTGQIMQDTTLSNAQKQQYGQTTTWSINKPTIAKPLFRAELYIGKKGKFYYRVLGRNNKVVIPSEPYNTRQGALKTLKRIQGLNFWGFKDLTTKK